MFESSHKLEDAVLAMGIGAHARLLVAVSGGPDSVALLDVLHRLSLQSRHRWSLMVGHVNHGLRGTESDEDEAFVRQLANQMNLPIEVAREATDEFASSHGLSEELAAREVRYVALADMLKRWPGDIVVTGHTADDQAETVIMHLLRGSGGAGLQGMHPRREGILRPFLSVRHGVILSALQEQNLGYRLDSSNLNERHFRNRIRRTLMPSLLREAPHAVTAVGRTAQILQTDGDYLDREVARFLESLQIETTEDGLKANSGIWLAAHAALRRRGLRAIYYMVGNRAGELTYEHVLTMESTIAEHPSGTTTRVELPGGIVFAAAGGHFTISRRGREAREPLPTVNLRIPGEVDLTVGKIEAQLLTGVSTEELRKMIAVCGPNHAICAASRMDREVMIRHWLHGDTIGPIGMRGSKKVQDVLTEGRVPKEIRYQIPIVADPAGIIWIPGYRLARRVQIDREATNIVHMQFTPASRKLK